MMNRACFTCCLLILAVYASRPPLGFGCAAAPPPGATVSIAEESAIIIWDAATKTQHFIRRASFTTSAPDFGFLVPTPTKPELAAGSDYSFQMLQEWIKPQMVEEFRGFVPMFCCMPLGCSSSVGPAGKQADAVRVLDSLRVAGYDVKVLEADDPQALGDWLTKHGYPSSPELTSWLGPYIAEHWKVTAFKIAHDPKTGHAVQTSAVRMTFRTEQPFFPYREPESQEAPRPGGTKRLLRVYYLGQGRADGRLGPNPWPAKIAWADQVRDEQRMDLAKELGVPTEHLPSGTWLTTFEDSSSPRPGRAEVFFEPATEQVSVRPQIVHSYRLYIPVDLIFLAIVAVGLGLLVRLRRRHVSRAEAS